MDRRQTRIRHKNNWIERHVVMSALVILVISILVSYIAWQNFTYGLAAGIILSTWLVMRCLAKEIYFSSVQRIRSGDNGNLLTDD